MPECVFHDGREAVWHVFLLVRVEGTENPILVPHDFICDIHRKPYEALGQAAPQAMRSALALNLAAGGYPPPRWSDSTVTFEKI